MRKSSLFLWLVAGLGSGCLNPDPPGLQAGGPQPSQDGGPLQVSNQSLHVAIVSPVDGTWVGTRGITVNGTASTVGTHIKLYLDERQVGESVSTEQGWSFDGVILDAGSHVLRAQATVPGGSARAQATVIGDISAPGLISDLNIIGVSRSHAILSWTAPADDSGRIASYEVRWSEAHISDVNFDLAQTAAPPTPVAAGQTQTLDISGLYTGHTIFFAVRAVDSAHNVAALSNIVNAQPDFTRTTLTPPEETAASASARFGASTAAGDFNGDGKTDLAVGAPGASFTSAASNEGAVYIYFGSDTGFRTRPDRVLHGRRGAALGTALVALDFDSDGMADLAVGAPGVASADGQGVARPVGAVYLLHGVSSFSFAGKTAAIEDSGVAWHVISADPNDTANRSAHLGTALTRAHFGLDLSDDLLLGAPGMDNDDGGAFVVRGAPTTPVAISVPMDLDNGMVHGARISTKGFSNGGQFGEHLANVGAPYGDVHETVALLSTHRGEIALFHALESGSTSIGASDAVAHLGQQDGTAKLNITHVCSAGDINGDGIRDLAVGEPGWSSQAGRIIVVDGASLAGGAYLIGIDNGMVVNAQAGGQGESYGNDLLPGVDINGDGENDLAVTTVSGSSTLTLRFGPFPFDNASVASRLPATTPAVGLPTLLILGDLNGDQLPDLAMADADAPGGGKVEVFR